MEKSSELKFVRVVIDTDVLLNWLTKEKDLWETPLRIVKYCEQRKLNGVICITSMMELRYVLRRKKMFKEEMIKWFAEELKTYFDISLPDEGVILLANKLQSEYPLGPFDAILLAFAISEKPSVLISRDNDLLKISSLFIKSFTPEKFISAYF
ncbi:MAG: PIN domain-containing protein [Elusimicrobiota bacterium]